MKIEVKNHIVALILSVEILWTLGDSNFCPVKKSDSEKDECDEFHQERPTWKDYLQKIEAARNDHVACEGLQCYLYVLERDLGPFRTIRWIYIKPIMWSKYNNVLTLASSQFGFVGSSASIGLPPSNIPDRLRESLQVQGLPFSDQVR